MNKTNKLSLALAALLFGLAGAAHAGKIGAVRVEPATIQAGGQVKVTVDGEDEGICGLRVEYGTGDVDVTKMAKDKDNFPRSFMHTYNQPGTFTIIAKGGRDGSTLGCTGDAKAMLTVTAPPPPPPKPAAPTPAAAMPAPACPDGFVLNKSSVNKKTGAFSCNAKKGAQLPSGGIACPANTVYYTNTAGTLLGCKAQPPAKK
jgi:hypothetical protein